MYCSILEGLVLGTWHVADVYKAEGQDWPLLPASDLPSATTFYVHKKCFTTVCFHNFK